MWRRSIHRRKNYPLGKRCGTAIVLCTRYLLSTTSSALFLHISDFGHFHWSVFRQVSIDFNAFLGKGRTMRRRRKRILR
jgi:hypothetical protein